MDCETNDCYEVSVSGVFAAAHQLRLAGGALEPLHGHNWRVVVTLRGPRLDEFGLLVDFTKLRPRLDAVLAELHECCLNDSPSFAQRNPSAENVARHVCTQMSAGLPNAVRLASVEVEEAPGCVARFYPGREST